MTQPQEIDLDSFDIGNLGLDNVALGIQPGKHRGIVQDIKRIDTEKEGLTQPQVIFAFKDLDTGDVIEDWMRVGPRRSADGQAVDWPNQDNDRKYFKQRIISLGVAEENVSQVKLSALKGTPVIFTVKVSGQYKNVSWVEYNKNNDSVGEMMNRGVVDPLVSTDPFNMNQTTNDPVGQPAEKDPFNFS